MNKPILIAIIFVALLLRLGVAFGIQSYLEKQQRSFLIAGDAEGYWELGRRLSAGESYQIYEPPRQMMRMPGYPLFLAGCLSLFGDSQFPVRLIQALLSTLAVALVFLLGRDLIDEKTGLVSATVLAISPAVVGFSAVLLGETLFAVLLLLNLWLACRWLKKDANAGHWRAALLVGISTTLVVYIRPTWLPALLVWGTLAVLKRPVSTRWREAALVVASGLLLLFPWASRNHAASGHWVLTTLWVGPSLFDGLHSGATGISEMSFFDRDQVMAQDGLTEYQMDRHYRAQTAEFLRSSPREAAGLMLVHASRYWSLAPHASEFQNRWLRGMLVSWTTIFFLLGTLGAWTFRRQWMPLVLTVGPILAFGIIHTIFVGSLRYRLPAEYPFSIAVGAGGICLWNQCRRTPSLAVDGVDADEENTEVSL